MHDLISPGMTGWDLAPASELPRTGCCGFNGPYPSATLDKNLTKLSKFDCRWMTDEEQYFLRRQAIFLDLASSD